MQQQIDRIKELENESDKIQDELLRLKNISETSIKNNILISLQEVIDPKLSLLLQDERFKHKIERLEEENLNSVKNFISSLDYNEALLVWNHIKPNKIGVNSARKYKLLLEDVYEYMRENYFITDSAITKDEDLMKDLSIKFPYPNRFLNEILTRLNYNIFMDYWNVTKII